MISILSQIHHLFTNSINCRIHQQRFKCLLLQLGGGALHLCDRMRIFDIYWRIIGIYIYLHITYVCIQQTVMCEHVYNTRIYFKRTHNQHTYTH